MKARAAVIQGGLAVVGLVVAYSTWQREPDHPLDEVVVLDITRAELERVRYEDATHWAEVVRHRDDSDNPAWVRFGTKTPPEPSSADGGVRDGGAADAGTVDAGVVTRPPPIKIVDRLVPGNEQAEKLLEKFAPLRAVRSLGALGAEKLKEVGLTDSVKRLEIFSHGTPHTYTVAFSNIGSPYLLDGRDGRVYLLAANSISEIDAASGKLVDRRLHLFKQGDADAVTVTVGDQKRQLAQVAGDNGQITKVSSASAPDKADDFAKNWLDKAWRIPAFEVLGKDEKPVPGDPVVQARVEFGLRGKSRGWMELAKAGTDQFIRTEHTAGWVKTRIAEDMFTEAAKVASGQ